MARDLSSGEPGIAELCGSNLRRRDALALGHVAPDTMSENSGLYLKTLQPRRDDLARSGSPPRLARLASWSSTLSDEPVEELVVRIEQPPITEQHHPDRAQC